MNFQRQILNSSESNQPLMDHRLTTFVDRLWLLRKNLLTHPLPLHGLKEQYKAEWNPKQD